MEKIIHWFQEGGILMWPLLICSLLTVAVIIERAWRLRRAALIDAAVVENVQTLVEQGKTDQAVERYRDSPVLVGRVLSKALQENRDTSAGIEASLVETGNRSLPALADNLAVLTLIAKVAPLLGLLGTVHGMILGFEHLEHTTVEKKELAHAIRVALVTTFTGLSIAIPALIANSYFRSRIRRTLAELEEIFIAVVKTVKNAPPPSVASPEPQAVAHAGRNAS